jgi:uncharacterized phage protein gp47/JayE
MTQFVELPVEVNAANLMDEVAEEMIAQFPNWEANEGNLETWLIRALVTRLIAPLAELSAEAGEEIFARFGEKIVGVVPLAAVSATVKTKWVVKDTAGYTIPAGTQVDITVTGSESVGFRVVNNVNIVAGKSEAKEVVLEAIEPGLAGNGLSGAATLVDALAFVNSVTLEGVTSGGVDAEEPSAYLDRLHETFETLAPRPIIARDVAILLRGIPGVQRVGVLDNWNGETEAEAEKALTIYPIDAAGNAVSEAIRNECLALLKAKREVNFLFFGKTPTSNTINVTATIVARVGFTQAQAVAQVKAAIETFLSPAHFGEDPQTADATTWNISTNTKLRFQDLVTVVNNVEACDFYTVLKWAIGAAEQKSEDLTMTGKAPLPKAGTVTVT